MLPEKVFRWKKNQNVIERIIEGEAVLLNMKTGVYYSLNEPGTAVWALLDEPRTQAEITEGILRFFKDTEDAALKRVGKLLTELAREKLAVKSEAG